MFRDDNTKNREKKEEESGVFEIVEQIASPPGKEILDTLTPENTTDQAQNLYEHAPSDEVLIDSLLAVGVSGGQIEEKFCTECYSYIEFEIGEYDECPYCNTSFS